jgi:hypothetical protein
MVGVNLRQVRSVAPERGTNESALDGDSWTRPIVHGNLLRRHNGELLQAEGVLRVVNRADQIW